MPDSTERIEGPTLNGGAYAIAHYSDEDGRPVDKAKATRVEIHEYSADGKLLMRTYAQLGR